MPALGNDDVEQQIQTAGKLRLGRQRVATPCPVFSHYPLLIACRRRTAPLELESLDPSIPRVGCPSNQQGDSRGVLPTRHREAYPAAVDPSTATHPSSILWLLVSMSNILMNRTRSRIVRFLVRNGPATCTEISTELQASSSTIRRHLNLLRRAGLVQQSSGEFDASPEQVQRQIHDLGASFHHTVMPPSSSVPMNEEHTWPFCQRSTLGHDGDTDDHDARTQHHDRVCRRTMADPEGHLHPVADS
ncbi:winged helix-turn-helix domain-containing protein [Arthrobacter sp. MMS18-M83]|uniref:winged helix-turn-helix domain-containing protein n=1 Tax=Arthrobacter sp. MMS18-M83 TaxID=2996261 RepID=UPI003FA38F71